MGGNGDETKQCTLDMLHFDRVFGMGHALIRATHLCHVCGPTQEKVHPKYTGKAILMLVAELV
jgi:hypothetical protein